MRRHRSNARWLDFRGAAPLARIWWPQRVRHRVSAGRGALARRMTEQLSRAQARRIALAAQGFGSPRSTPPARAQIKRIVDRLGVVQIDSVNVLARAHYMPAYSRLGCYDRSLLDGMAWGRKSERRLFEYWAHEASLLPIEFQPLLRWRMARADCGEAAWTTL